MRPGRLDRRVVIERAAVVQNALGEEIESWSAWQTVWAEVAPLDGAERWQAQEVMAEAPTRFRLRWLPGLSVEDRIRYEDRLYDIHSINEIGRRRGWEVLAKARADRTAGT